MNPESEGERGCNHLESKMAVVPLFLTALLILSSCSALVPYARAAPGDLIWAKRLDQTPGEEAWAYGVAVDTTGVYIVGEVFDGVNWWWRVEKRTLDRGDLVWAKTLDPTPGEEAWARRVAVDSTGVYIVGVGDDGVNSWWRVEKRTLDRGDLIWAKTSDPTQGAEAYGVAVDTTGVYIVGEVFDGVNWWWRVEKRTLDRGDLVWAKTLDRTPGEEAWPYGVAVDSTGVYIVGYVDGLGIGWWSRVEKRTLDRGDLIWAKTSDPTQGAMAYGVAVDTTGVYIVGGELLGVGIRLESLQIQTGQAMDDGTMKYATMKYGGWRIEKRTLDRGDLVWANSSDPDPRGWGEVGALGVAVDSTGVYMVGVDFEECAVEWECAAEWWVEKRTTTQTVDSDGDGVPDTQDKCPNTPPDVQVDKDGCPVDSDGDGVPDTQDKCPNTPPDVQVDEKGCPKTVDSDGDGVPDTQDKCPNTPPDVQVDKDGCPVDSDGDGVPDAQDKCPGTPPDVQVDEKGCPITSREYTSVTHTFASTSHTTGTVGTSELQAQMTTSAVAVPSEKPLLETYGLYIGAILLALVAVAGIVVSVRRRRRHEPAVSVPQSLPEQP